MSVFWLHACQSQLHFRRNDETVVRKLWHHTAYVLISWSSLRRENIFSFFPSKLKPRCSFLWIWDEALCFCNMKLRKSPLLTLLMNLKVKKKDWCPLMMIVRYVIKLMMKWKQPYCKFLDTYIVHLQLKHAFSISTLFIETLSNSC